MPDRRELLAELRGRVERARETGEDSALRTAGAARAATLLAPAAGPAPDLDSAAVLGWYHWLRFRPGDEDGQENLVQAVRFLARVHAVDPGAVPPELTPVYAGDERTATTDAQDAFELGVLLALAHERDRTVPLNRATAFLRVAVERGLAEPLDRAMALNNLGCTLRMTHEATGDGAILDEAVRAAREAARATWHPEHAMFLSNLGLGLLQVFDRDGDTAALEEAVTVCRRAVVVTRPGHPHLPRFRLHLGLLRGRWAELHDDAAAGAEAITLLGQAVSATDARDPSRVACLTLLAALLTAQFRRTGDSALLDEALSAGRQAAAAAPEGHPQCGAARLRLAETLETRGVQGPDLDLLREAVAVARDAPAAAGASGRAGRLHQFGWCLQSLADALPGGDEGDAAAAEAVALAREAVAVAPDAAYRNGLSRALLVRFQRTGDPAAVVEAADAARAAVDATAADDPARPGWMNTLVFALFRLHDVVGGDDILREAIAVGREAAAALPAGHRYRPAAQSHLGAVLVRAYEHTGRRAYVEEAIDRHRSAVAECRVPASAYKWQMNLGMALASLARNSGSRDPAEEAVTVLREVLDALPDTHPERGTVLNNLALALLFVPADDPAVVLREAARTARAAVAATPARHLYHALHLNSLCLVLQTLAWQTGDSAPLGAAVAAGRDACRAAPRGHPHRAMFLGNLCSALRRSYARAGRHEDIVEAVQACREGLETLARDHPYRVRLLHQLAEALVLRSVWDDDADLAAETIESCREAAAQQDDEGSASLWGTALLSRALLLAHLRNKDITLLREAVLHSADVVTRVGPEPQDRAAALNQHAAVLYVLYDRTGEHPLLEESLAAARTVGADESAEPELRVASHRLLAAWSDSVEALASAESIVGLLPRLGSGALDRGDRGQLLGGLGAVAPAVAGAALSAGRPRQAVELLEQSRGVLTAEPLAAVGADLDRLRSAAPELADEFVALRSRQESLDLPAPSAGDSPVAPESLAVVRMETQGAWHDVLRRIRALDGFADFLRPPRAAALTAAAADGPVVYVYATPRRSDALVLTGDPEEPVSVVPLHGLREAEAAERVPELRAALDRSVDPTVDPTVRRAAQDEVLDVLAWLWDTVAEPVLTALGHTAPPAAGAPWPRLWWCPVGHLAHLPLHAAGHHRDLLRPDGEPHRRAPRTVLDRVISSYTATARGLARARAPRPRPAGQARSAVRTAVVAVPEAPGAGSLPGAIAEAALLARLVPSATVLTEPTRAAVLDTLQDHRIVHFACHHRPARIDPWQGTLLLPDHRTDPLTVSDISALRLDGGLAYLSACSTMLTRFTDEALHLSGAFQLAGYRHVVGTLWPVGDRPAQQLAGDFYGLLTRDGRHPPDLDGAAVALHHAVRSLRAKYPRTPTLWAAHTHTGV
ncbi:CHAT domain-containing protein [Streptomyces sp. NPDC127100]|uniref:CHAT domain-containing protein n=1 Tax=Streptomyces sp. NPDC127100 TaxID=3347138 RepID=UPI00365791EA